MENDSYKKFLADVLYEHALRKGKEELRTTSFYDEETTNHWTLEQFQFQYVKDQIEFFEGGNLDSQVDRTWRLIYADDN